MKTAAPSAHSARDARISEPAAASRQPVQAAGEQTAIASKVRQRRKADRAHELLEAALDLFVEKGLAATRTEEVAHRAGVSKGTLYLYYASKEDLFKAVVRAHLIDAISATNAVADQFTGPTPDLLRLLAETWWAKVGSSKAAGLLLLIMSEARTYPDVAQFYLDEVVHPSHQLLARVLERGIRRGEFRELDITSVVHGLIAPTQFLVFYRQCTSVCAHNPVPLDPQRFMQTQIDLVLKGLERTPADHTT